ncbi:DUF2339 domain-containing protein [Patescibacteria group bacterium]|nr:DUF2339 domain-containing protein [Patescibacteria group bacterium]
MAAQKTPLSAQSTEQIKAGISKLKTGLVVFGLIFFFAGSRFFFPAGILYIIPLVLCLKGLTNIQNAFTRAETTPQPQQASVPQPQAVKQVDEPLTGFGAKAAAEMELEMTAPQQQVKKAQKEPEPSWTENVNWEEWIGKKLLQKVGIIIVLIGMVVLLKYSFDNGFIGELGRIGLATLGGAILLGAGEFFRKKYPDWFQAFTGGGLALLYFTVWAASVFYAEALMASHGLEISPIMSTFLYSFITVIGALASIRYRSQIIAWFTVLGGYLTPLLIEASPNPTLLSTYLAILSIGIILLSWKQKWPFLNIAAFAFTQFYLFGIVYQSSVFGDMQQSVVAIGFFALFGMLPIINQFKMHQPTRPDEVLMILANATIVFIAVVDALGGYYSQYTGLVSLGLAAVMLAYGATALHRCQNDKTLISTYLVSTVILIALALLVELKWEWVAVGWAPFSALLVFVSMKLKQPGPWICAIVLLLGSILALGTNMPILNGQPDQLWHPFTSAWALQNYVVFASIISWVFMSKSLPPALVDDEGTRKHIIHMLHFGLAALLFVAITFEATGLDWTIDLPLTYSYLVFAAIAMGVFLMARTAVWLVAAVIAQILALLFIFMLGEGSGMAMLFNGSNVTPIAHPWALASLAALAMTGIMVIGISHPRSIIVSKIQAKTALIAVALAQVWVHVTVEIQQMDMSYNWSTLFGSRILSGWWIAFAIAVAIFGLYKKNDNFKSAGFALLCIPFLKDTMMLFAGKSTFYETILWTVLPLLTAWTGVRTQTRQLVVGGMLILGIAIGVDVIMHVGDDAGFWRTIWWAITGLASMSMGFVGRAKLLRQAAIAIFGVTVIKLLLFDFATLETGVRIGASIATGLLLIGASYLYQRFDSMLQESK